MMSLPSLSLAIAGLLNDVFVMLMSNMSWLPVTRSYSTVPLVPNAMPSRLPETEKLSVLP